MHAECVCYSHRERSYDSRDVKDDRDSDREHEELHKPNDLAGEEKEYRDDPDNPQEQRPEECLQIRHEPVAAERDRGCRSEHVRCHRYSGCGERDLRGSVACEGDLMATTRAAPRPARAS